VVGERAHLEVLGPVANPGGEVEEEKGLRGQAGNPEGVQQLREGIGWLGPFPGSFPHTHVSAMKASFAAVKSG